VTVDRRNRPRSRWPRPRCDMRPTSRWLSSKSRRYSIAVPDNAITLGR
jgi:hypothetical protein